MPRHSTSITLPCLACGIEYRIAPSTIQVKIALGTIPKYCSRRCHRGYETGLGIEAAFLRNLSEPDPVTGCVLWKGAQWTSGYGQLDRSTGAHRYAWERTNGPIPRGMHVCHTCDVKLCVAVEHLFLGTNAENRADSVRKGRTSKGVRHYLARFTEDDVREIRARYAVGDISQQALAEQYGTTQTNIGHVVRRKTWKHVE
jgi:hypothetical protein